MVSPKTLIRIARKWQKQAEKGHFVVYTVDQKRCVLPIRYLGSYVFRELLKMSEEEFGLPADGPIKVPCEAAFMEYAVSLIRRHVDPEVEQALVLSVARAAKCSSCDSNLFLSAMMVCGF